MPGQRRNHPLLKLWSCLILHREAIFLDLGRNCSTSIGKKHAPALCCLGAGKLEEDIKFPAELFRGLVIKDKGSADESDRFYKRFIDDMMALSNGTADDAKEFVGWLNTLWPGLQCTYEWSNQEITFLDVRLVIENGKLETDRYIKTTNP